MSTEVKKCPRSMSFGEDRKWIRPDVISKCTWHSGAKLSDSPHYHAKLRYKKPPVIIKKRCPNPSYRLFLHSSYSYFQL